MKHKFWLPAAVVLSLTAVPGRAQAPVGSPTVPSTPGGQIFPGTQGVQIVPGTSTIQIVPNFGFVPFDPRFSFFPGFGAGYFPWGPISMIPEYPNLSVMGPIAMPRGPFVPVLGVNTPVPTPGRPVARRQQRITERVAGAREETPRTDPEQVALTTRMATIMEDRPMRQGTVAAVGATGVQVRFTVNGATRVERYPITDVFFFQENGDLATAATDPGSLREGQQVLVPDQRGEPVAAGSRQSRSNGAEGNIVIRPAAQQTRPSTSNRVKVEVKPATSSTARKSTVKPKSKRR